MAFGAAWEGQWVFSERKEQENVLCMPAYVVAPLNMSGCSHSFSSVDVGVLSTFPVWMYYFAKAAVNKVRQNG